MALAKFVNQYCTLKIVYLYTRETQSVRTAASIGQSRWQGEQQRLIECSWHRNAQAALPKGRVHILQAATNPSSEEATGGAHGWVHHENLQRIQRQKDVDCDKYPC